MSVAMTTVSRHGSTRHEGPAQDRFGTPCDRDTRRSWHTPAAHGRAVAPMNPQWFTVAILALGTVGGAVKAMRVWWKQLDAPQTSAMGTALEHWRSYLAIAAQLRRLDESDTADRFVRNGNTHLARELARFEVRQQFGLDRRAGAVSLFACAISLPLVITTARAEPGSPWHAISQTLFAASFTTYLIGILVWLGAGCWFESLVSKAAEKRPVVAEKLTCAMDPGDSSCTCRQGDRAGGAARAQPRMALLTKLWSRTRTLRGDTPHPSPNWRARRGRRRSDDMDAVCDTRHQKHPPPRAPRDFDAQVACRHA